MTRTVSLISKNGPGYGLPDGRFFPCSGVSGKAVTATFCSSHGGLILPRVKIGTLSWAPKGGASFVCKATASGNKENPGASKQSKSRLSRGKNKQNNEEGDDLELNEELEPDFSKSGSFHSLSSNNPSPQATATPGRKEKEIAELFRKVQVQLRERAASKKGKKKVEEAVKEESTNKSIDTIGPLLQLLRKHSSEKDKGSIRDIVAKDKPAENGAISHGMDSYPFSSTEAVVDKAPRGSTSSRSPSKFTRKSPIPREKPNSSDDENFGQFVSRWTSSTSSDTRKKHQGGISAEPEEEPEMESESESDSGYSPVKSRWTPKETKKTKKTILTDILPELEDDPDFDSILDSDSDSDTELDLEPEPAAPEIKTEAVYSFSDEDAYDENENETETETVDAAEEEVDLTGLKVVELRELAKSRGLKKTSKMKKDELIELLSNSA